MRRASKILTLVLVVVFLFSIFAGCDLIGRDVAKYRSATALTVGNEKITVGKLLDTFNSYYNSNYYYVAYGMMTLDDVLEQAVEALYAQYIKVDSYVKNTDNVKVKANANLYHNAEYLEQEELNYSINYVKYLIFTTLDSGVDEKVESKYSLKDKEEEDTSRDFYEYDDLTGYKTYAEYYFAQTFKNEDMQEYLDKYYDGSVAQSSASTLDLYLASAEKKVAELNERLEEEEAEIKVEDYQKIQKTVFKQYENTVKNTYDISFDAFVTTQIEDMITNGIIARYNFEKYKNIEDESDMAEVLEKNYYLLRDEQEASFNINNGFESFIQGLSSSSVIYTIPEEYAGQYVFVKNILIPFSSKQSKWLSSLSADLGTEDNDLYKDYRNFLAQYIEADDYTSDKDEDGKYTTKLEQPFVYENGEVKINPACEELSAYLQADGSVKAMEDMTELDTILELMKLYNTDTAQHSSLFSYVVRAGEKESEGGKIPDSYSHQWVQEFVDATNAAIKASKAAGNEDGTGYYSIGVSNYGVHIVYVVSVVEPEVFNFSNPYLDTHSAEYRLFKNYFEKQASILITDDLKELQKTYVNGNLIGKEKIFDKFIKENNLSYDFQEKLEKFISEEN